MTPADIRQFAAHAQAYIALLREHIEKEDHCLFAMANQALSQQDQQQLLEAFEQVEREHMGAGIHEKFVRVADELAERFGVSPAIGNSGRGCGCGCHHT